MSATPQYQIVHFQDDAWCVFDNWSLRWIKATFNSEGAALAYISSRHPNKVITEVPA
jgi:hypothetical protein